MHIYIIIYIYIHIIYTTHQFTQNIKKNEETALSSTHYEKNTEKASVLSESQSKQQTFQIEFALRIVFTLTADSQKPIARMKPIHDQLVG